MRLGPLHITRHGFAFVWGERGAFSAANLARYSQQFQAGAGSDRTGDDAISSDGPALRRVGRELVRNNPTAKTLVKKTVYRTVGPNGPTPKINVPGGKKIEERWREWSGNVDLSREIDWGKFCRLAFAEFLTVGESFCYENVVGGELRLGMFEPQQLADTGLHAAHLANSESVVRDGIRYDRSTAQKLAYVFQQFDPGFSYMAGNYVEMAAARVRHLYDKERPTQTRGVSLFACLAVALHDRNDIRHANLLLNKAAAYFGLFLSGDNPSTILKAIGAENVDAVKKVTMQPGTLNALPSGVTATAVTAKTPPPEYQALEKALTNEAAVTAGLAPAAVSGDYSGVNFSSARMAARENEPQEKTARHDFERMVAAPLLESWLRVEAAAGRINANENRIAAIMRGLRWDWPVPAYHDPEKEVTAIGMEIEQGLKSWSQAATERGQDPQDLAKRIAADQALGESLGIKLPGPIGSGAAPPAFPAAEAPPEETADEPADESEGDEAQGAADADENAPEEETA